MPPPSSDRGHAAHVSPPGFARPVLLLAWCLLGVIPVPARALIVDPTIPSLNGTVNSAAMVGDTIYMGGNFGRVGTLASAGLTGSDRPDGVPSGKWPAVTGFLSCVAPDGHGGWYIGGGFASVAGVARRFLAHLHPDGSLDGWGPEPDGEVNAMVVSGGTIFIGGNFGSVGGQARLRLAAIDVATGSVLPWNPGADQPVLALAANNSTVFVGGTFGVVGGQPRKRLAAVDRATGGVAPWVVDADAPVRALLLDDEWLYVGGDFRTVWSFERRGIARLDAATGFVMPQSYGVNGSVHALAIGGTTLFAGGEFTSVRGVLRDRLVAFDLNTEIELPWNPGANATVRSLVVSGNTLFAGGLFTTIGGQSRTYAAALDAGTGAALPWDMSILGLVYNGVYAVGCDGTTVLACGQFTGSGGTPRLGLAAMDVRTNELLPWGPAVTGTVNTLVVVRNTVIVGGSFSAVGGLPRSNVAAIDARTGEVLHWNPSADSHVNTMLVCDSTLFLGGHFGNLGGGGPYLVAFDLNTLERLPWSAGVNGGIYALARRDSTLFVGGLFTSLAGQPRYCLGAIHLRTGAALPFNPNPNNIVLSFAVRDDQNQWLYVGGGFSTVQGLTRRNLAAIDLATGQVLPWNPAPNGWVTFLQLSGTSLRVGGDYNQIGGADLAYFSVLDANTGALLPWDANVNGPVKYLGSRSGATYIAGQLWSESLTRPMYRSALMRLVNPGSFAAISATALYPNGGETLPIGGQVALRWAASGGVPGVQNADLYLSQSGPNGPWQLIAARTPNDGQFDWLVTGPASAGNAYLRVDSRDWNGVSGTDRSNAGFSIRDMTTPVLLELFRASASGGSVEIEWEFSAGSAPALVELQRGTGPSGEFVRVAAAPRVEGRVTRVTDTAAPTDVESWYRLAGQMGDGLAFTSAPISVTPGERVTELALAPLAPNPARGAATVSYALPRAARVRLSLLDVQGREIAVLADADRAAGKHVAQLVAGDLATGLYFVRLMSQGATLTRRVAIVK